MFYLTNLEYIPLLEPYLILNRGGFLFQTVLENKNKWEIKEKLWGKRCPLAQTERKTPLFPAPATAATTKGLHCQMPLQRWLTAREALCSSKNSSLSGAIWFQSQISAFPNNFVLYAHLTFKKQPNSLKLIIPKKIWILNSSLFKHQSVLNGFPPKSTSPRNFL